MTASDKSIKMAAAAVRGFGLNEGETLMALEGVAAALRLRAK